MESSFAIRMIGRTARSTRFVVYALLIAFMANLGAMVDALLHPDIPWFDEEHLLVGGLSAVLLAALALALESFLIHLQQAIAEINRLASFIAICSSCKKVRLPGKHEGEGGETWMPLEHYVQQQTTTRFSHGICPDCMESYLTELE